MWSGNRQPLGISALCGRLLTAIPVSSLDVVVRTLVSRIPGVHLYLSQQRGVRSSKTSQCGSAIDIVSSQLYVCHILVSKKCQLQAGTIHPRPLA